ncbi:MAG TPA: DNA repair protein RecO, partial [Burkholderiaceae bacterium]|nr:DNA repair protein RecO [Burkholderiaceae bacterium]
MSPEAMGTPSARRSRRFSDSRVEQQPAFVLHSYPWRETSLIVDVLTRDHGRVALAARGAKRPTSHFRGLLAPFAPIAVSWSGRAEIKSLVRAEWVGGLAPLRGDELLSAFYLNELLVRLLARGDPHEALFFSYAHALRALSLDAPQREQALRGFELDLLREIGVAPSFESTSDGSPIDPDAWYRVDPEHGVRCVAAQTAPAAEYCVRGRTMQALARRDLAAVSQSQDARALLRQLIGYHLHGRPLNTQRI